MKKLLITLSYDGTNYHGWQVQNNAVTVQQVFQDAVEKVTGLRSPVAGCSRTDAGVHANMFCLSMETEMNIPETNMVKALNAALPGDIAVKSVRQVPDDFHARYSCKGKEYIYRIYNGQERSPFEERYSLHYRYPIDIDLLNSCCCFFSGTHDFVGFSSSGRSVTDTVRTIKKLGFEQDKDIITFKIEADGFLYNMVRIIVGTFLSVAQGKTMREELGDIIASGERNRAGITVPPQGLFLNRVFY